MYKGYTDKQNMDCHSILKNNKFAGCSKEELTILWQGLKRFYSEGWCAADNPLTPYKNAYCEESHIGVFLVEQDLLKAIACEFFGER